MPALIHTFHLIYTPAQQGNTVTERSPGVVTPHLGSGSTSPPGKTHLDLISGNLFAEGGRGGVTVVLILDLIQPPIAPRAASAPRILEGERGSATKGWSEEEVLNGHDNKDNRLAESVSG